MEANTASTSGAGHNLNDLQTYLVTFNKEIEGNGQPEFTVVSTPSLPTGPYSAPTGAEAQLYQEDVDDNRELVINNAATDIDNDAMSAIIISDSHTTVLTDEDLAELNNPGPKVVSLATTDLDSSVHLSAVHAQIAGLSGGHLKQTGVAEFIPVSSDDQRAVGNSPMLITESGDLISVVSVTNTGGITHNDPSPQEVIEVISNLAAHQGDANLLSVSNLLTPEDGIHQEIVDAPILETVIQKQPDIIDGTDPVAVLASVAANTSNAASHLQPSIIINQSEVPTAQLVAVQNSSDSTQPQLVAVNTHGAEGIQILNALDGNMVTPMSGTPMILNSANGNYQTVTIMPTADATQVGEVSYVLIVSQPEDKDGKPLSVDQNIYDFKEDCHEITEEIIEENGTVRRILKFTKKPVFGPNAPMLCCYCPYSTTKRYLLTRHMKTHSDERPHKCQLCEKGFKTLASLQNHVNTHTGTRPHKCKDCESAFTTSGELVRHMRYRHTFERPHKCTECDYCSVELSKMKRHMRSHTGERPYKCQTCSYASPDMYKLKRHLRIHSGEKPYGCEICHARFTQSNSLKAHRLIHTGEKPVFQCELCPATCGRKTDLKIHMEKLHMSEKPLLCRKCDKCFPDRYQYKIHVKCHEGEKCFKCAMCDYAALSERHLENHILTHSGEKPFQCDECDLSFRQKQLLKRHKNLYHTVDYMPPTPKSKEHDCDECEKSFAHRGNLKRHVSQHETDGIYPGRKRDSSLNNGMPVTAQQLLDGGLLEELQNCKTGEIPPQVVIVHPDGRVEEINTKAQTPINTILIQGQEQSSSMEHLLQSMADSIPHTSQPPQDPDHMRDAGTQVEIDSDTDDGEELTTMKKLTQLQEGNYKAEQMQSIASETHSRLQPLVQSKTVSDLQPLIATAGVSDLQPLIATAGVSDLQPLIPVGSVSELEPLIQSGSISKLSFIPSEIVSDLEPLVMSSREVDSLTQGDPSSNATLQTSALDLDCMGDHHHTAAVDQTALVSQSLPFASAAGDDPSSHVGVQYTQHLSPATLEMTAAPNEAATLSINIEQIHEPSVVDYDMPSPQPADEYDLPLQHSDNKYNLALQLSSTSDDERQTDRVMSNIGSNMDSHSLNTKAIIAEGPINQLTSCPSDLPGADPSLEKSTPIVTRTVVTRQIDTRGKRRKELEAAKSPAKRTRSSAE